MSNLKNSKLVDLIDKFNDTSRYLDNIFTIDNPAFTKHIPDIYPRELHLNRANISDNESLGPRHRRCGSPIIITLSVCSSVCSSVCPSVHLSVCPSVRPHFVVMR